MLRLRRKNQSRSKSNLTRPLKVSNSTLISCLFPTLWAWGVYLYMYSSSDVIAMQGSLVDFFGFCASGYFIAMLICWVGVINVVTKLVCIVHFTCLIVNGLLAISYALTIEGSEFITAIDNITNPLSGFIYVTVVLSCLFSKLSGAFHYSFTLPHTWLR